MDLIKANKTSSGALRPTFSKILLKALKNFALLVANEHLNLAETSRYIPKYLAEVAHVIADPETVTQAQWLLCREP